MDVNQFKTLQIKIKKMGKAKYVYVCGGIWQENGCFGQCSCDQFNIQ